MGSGVGAGWPWLLPEAVGGERGTLERRMPVSRRGLLPVDQQVEDAPLSGPNGDRLLGLERSGRALLQAERPRRLVVENDLELVVLMRGDADLDRARKDGDRGRRVHVGRRRDRAGAVQDADRGGGG